MKYKILIPVDFSENSWNGIKYASQLFKNHECDFYLLNVYTPTIYNMDYAMPDTNVYNLGEVSINRLRETKDRIISELINQKHHIKTISSFNSLIPEIEDIVNEKKIDLIIMGTKGATGANQILFGSNTVHAIKRAICPLLAIPDNYEFNSLNNILFPSDYGIHFTLNQINPIVEIAKSHKAKLHVLNVSYGYELSEIQFNNKSMLELYLTKVDHLFHSVPDKDLQEVINNFQINNETDMLVMINNKHSFFENIFFKSVINQIGFHLNMPFLVIPAKN